MYDWPPLPSTRVTVVTSQSRRRRRCEDCERNAHALVPCSRLRGFSERKHQRSTSRRVASRAKRLQVAVTRGSRAPRVSRSCSWTLESVRRCFLLSSNVTCLVVSTRWCSDTRELYSVDYTSKSATSTLIFVYISIQQSRLLVSIQRSTISWERHATSCWVFRSASRDVYSWVLSVFYCVEGNPNCQAAIGEQSQFDSGLRMHILVHTFRIRQLTRSRGQFSHQWNGTCTCMQIIITQLLMDVQALRARARSASLSRACLSHTFVLLCSCAHPTALPRARMRVFARHQSGRRRRRRA